MKVLVVGGAGYIGSHMVWYLGQAGAKVIVLDDLSSGHEDAVLHGELVVGDMADTNLLNQIFRSSKIDAVMHFASFIQVGESLRDPAKYYKNNVSKTLVLLESMRRHDVRRLIFSSTAAIFGEPQYWPIDEVHPMQPVNPYGRTKLMIEQVLDDYDRAYGVKSVCLRYFNAAGAHPDGILGERHDPETHLIPLALQAASGVGEELKVFGRDYPTPDGTCIRDYIHVLDLAEAHWMALQYLASGGESKQFNLGNGTGYSVAEILRFTGEVTGRSVPVRDAVRRPGDPAVLVADSSRIREQWGWHPKRGDIKTMIEDSWRFMSTPKRNKHAEAAE